MADVYAYELPPEDAVIDLPTAGAGSGIGRLQKAALREAVHDLLTEQDLADLGSRVVQDWERDKEGNKDWREKAEAALDAAAQEKVEAKNYPFVGAANVKYPLLTISSMAFSSRAVPAIIKGDEAIKVKTFGKANASEKQARADRVAEYLNYLLFYKVDGWEQDTDAMLVRLPAVGQHYRKVWWDPIKQRCCIESVSALRLTLPCDAKSLQETPRATHDYDRYPFELQKLMRSGHFRQVELQPENASGDDQAARVILEQYRYEDLDGDGLDEPYIVTVDAVTSEVLRIDEGWDDDGITYGEQRLDADERPMVNDLGEPVLEVLNIERSLPFVDYGFIPDPKGRAYSIGFGHLLTPIMDVVNTNINLMIDAGHAQVAGGGFVGNEVRLQGAGQNGNLRWQPGEYKNVNASGQDIRTAIFERTFPAPSPVLFELLGLLMDAAKDIASVNDAITGDASRNAPVGTTLALIEQGQQVFNAIYKRIYRGLREEFKLFADCVAKYGDPEDYAKFVDVPAPQMGHNGGPPMAPQGAPDPMMAQGAPQGLLPPPGAPPVAPPMDPAAQFEADFNFEDLDIRPISDPSAVTKAQQMAKMQLALTFLGQGIYADDRAVVRATLQAGGLEEADDWIPEQAPPNPMQEAAAKLQMALGQVEVQLKAAQAGKLQAEAQASQANLQMDAAKTQADVTLKGAQTAKIVDEIQGASAVQEARQALSDLENDEVDRQKKRAETAMTFMQPQLENEREERNRETAK